MNTAIIVAAGSGNRFGGKIPKQFLEINEKPVLIYTIEKFDLCEDIDEIIVVLSKDWLVDFSNKIESFNFSKPIKLVVGGKTRAESVLNGLKTIETANAGIISVHDGARPLVSTNEISKTINKANETGAACLVGKVTDTIKKVSAGKIEKTIDRNDLRRALTPQCFQYDILKSAFESNNSFETATDECTLVENNGFEVSIVEGSAKNIKITHEEDLEIAKIFLENN